MVAVERCVAKVDGEACTPRKSRKGRENFITRNKRWESEFSTEGEDELGRGGEREGRDVVVTAVKHLLIQLPDRSPEDHPQYSLINS
jgi:hypothetical protein